MSNPQESKGPATPPDPVRPAADSKKPADAHASVPKEISNLAAEEQLALYEEHLKESDWGHQPC